MTHPQLILVAAAVLFAVLVSVIIGKAAIALLLGVALGLLGSRIYSVL